MKGVSLAIVGTAMLAIAGLFWLARESELQCERDLPDVGWCGDIYFAAIMMTGMVALLAAVLIVGVWVANWLTRKGKAPA